jgi:hypothetical protein
MEQGCQSVKSDGELFKGDGDTSSGYMHSAGILNGD